MLSSSLVAASLPLEQCATAAAVAMGPAVATGLVEGTGRAAVGHLSPPDRCQDSLVAEAAQVLARSVALASSCSGAARGVELAG